MITVSNLMTEVKESIYEKIKEINEHEDAILEVHNIALSDAVSGWRPEVLKYFKIFSKRNAFLFGSTVRNMIESAIRSVIRILSATEGAKGSANFSN